MSTIQDEDLQKLEDEILKEGYVDREHLLKFLTLIPTNDGEVIVQEVRDWLKKLSDDAKLSKVAFTQTDIEVILSDLDSYGRVQPRTILEFKRNTNRNPPTS